MDFSLDADVEILQRSVLDFIAREFADSRPGDQAIGFDQARWDKCAEFGIQSLPIAERYGGLGKDLQASAAALQTLGRGCRDGGLLFALSCHLGTCALPILHFGTDAQKNQYLPGMAAGDLIGGHAITESNLNADGMVTDVQAVRTDSGFTLHGVERFASNAPNAHVFLVFANAHEPLARAVEQESAQTGITAFLIARDSPGLVIGEPHQAMGLGRSLIAELAFDQCRVPDSAVLGSPGDGQVILAERFRWFLCCLLACTLGRMERQLDEACEYARTRNQFGKPIGHFQTLAHKLADMKMRVELARLLVYRLVWAQTSTRTAGPTELRDAELFAAIGRLFVGQAYVASSRDAIQVHGGYGYMDESGVARDLSDALGYHAVGGTADSQRDIIALILGLGATDLIQS